MIETSKLSQVYDIRRLDDSDADSILSFCQKNTQFYKYCEAEPTREQVLKDLHITPPGIGLSDKGYMEKCHSKLIERQKSIENERDIFYKKV